MDIDLELNLQFFINLKHKFQTDLSPTLHNHHLRVSIPTLTNQRLIKNTPMNHLPKK